MTFLISLTFGALVTTYVFLRFILRATQDAKEPPAIASTLPFIGPIFGMARERSSFFLKLRDTHRLPIYTLRLPFQRLYVVNSTDLIPTIQKHWQTISFSALTADAGRILGFRQEAIDILSRDQTSNDGFSATWAKYISGVMAAGEDLDSMNRRAVEVYAHEMYSLTRRSCERGLWEWTRDLMTTSTSEAVWGPRNPFRDPVVIEAWRTFEPGFLTLNIFPFASLLFPHLLRAREKVATAFIRYMHDGDYTKASGLVRKRMEHHSSFGLTFDDMGRGELGNAFAVLSSSTPGMFWLIYHIYSDEGLLNEVRHEISGLVDHKEDGEVSIKTVDLARIRDSCPVLLSAFQEVLRYRAVNPGPRVILEDVDINGWRLKMGSRLMIPAPVQHTDTSAWGHDATSFNHLRFMPVLGRKRPPKIAFRAFGGGYVLCPGRHFASTEMMALAALLVLRFDIVPTSGKWVEPSWDRSPAHAGFPIPDKDISVEFKNRDGVDNTQWNVLFSGSEKTMEIVTEDTVVGAHT